MRLSRLLAKLWRHDRGSSAVEYGMLLAAVVLGMLFALSSFANGFQGMWNNVANKVDSSVSQSVPS